MFNSPSRTRSPATALLFATALVGSACGDDSTSATGTATMTGTDTDAGTDTGTGSSVTITTTGVTLDDTGTADVSDTLVDSSSGPSRRHPARDRRPTTRRPVTPTPAPIPPPAERFFPDKP